MDFMQEFYFSKLGIVGHPGEFFSVDEGESWSSPEVVFAQNKFYYIKEGNCEFCINDETYEGIPGRLFLIPAGIPHSYRKNNSEKFGSYKVFFDIYPNNIGIFNLWGLPPYVDAKGDYLMCFFFNDYIERYSDSRIADILHIKSCLVEMIVQYMVLAGHDGYSVKNSKNNVFNRIIEFVDENIDRSISNEELATQFHFHPNHLIRVFKKKTGQTPAKYIMTRKMEMAKQLIEDTELEFKEIMHRVGINDASLFSKMFKRIYGLPPRGYSQKVRNIYRMSEEDESDAEK